MSAKGFAEQVTHLSFTVGVIVKTGTHNPFPRTPNNPPEATLEDYVLTFTAEHVAYTLALFDDNDEVVYTVYVSDNTDVVVLPSIFIGTYNLHLIPETGDYYFYSEIEL